MSKNIWYLHGAHATSRSFNWLRRELPSHESFAPEYITQSPIRSVLNGLVEEANRASEPFDIVGHSLGGVLAIAIAQKSTNVRNVVTIGSPFGGSEVASLMRWFAPGSILEDIRPNSPMLQSVRGNWDKLKLTPLCIVTTGGGNPLMAGDNDGVITVDSQMALHGAKYVFRDVNHFECLLDLEVAKLIEEHLWQTSMS